jgi:hypothetical protein
MINETQSSTMIIATPLKRDCSHLMSVKGEEISYGTASIFRAQLCRLSPRTLQVRILHKWFECGRLSVSGIARAPRSKVPVFARRD